MKFLWVLLLFICCSFVPVQVLKTVSEDVPVKGGFYTFENEKLTIVYNFWAERGTFVFAVLNRTDAPLYINWEQSGFLFNGGRIDYRVDRPAANVNSDTLDRSAALSFTWAEKLLGKSIGTYAAPVGEVTAIAPHGVFAVGRYRLMEVDIPLLYPDKVKFCEGEQNQTKLFRRTYNEDNTPFMFGNHLVYATQADFADADTLKHHFWVNEIIKMNNLSIDRGQTCPYTPNTSYYIKMHTGRY